MRSDSPFDESRTVPSPTWGACGLSRRCTGRIGPADRRSVTEATMRAGEVVVVQPGLEVLVALLGVGPMANVSPFAQSGLDKAFGFAIGARGVRAGEVVTNAELETGLAELVGAVGRAVVGKQGADVDTMLGVESQGLA